MTAEAAPRPSGVAVRIGRWTVSKVRTSAFLGWLAIVAPLTLWALALWPAVMTNDSIDTWNQAAVGPVVAWHPPTYTFMQRAAHLSFGTPAVIVLVQCAAMAWAMRRLLDVSVVLGMRRWVAYGFAAAIAALPPVGAFTAHVWKDVPFTIGFLLITGWLARRVLERLGVEGDGANHEVRELVVLAVALLLVLTMRQNGPYLVLGVAAALVVVAEHRRLVATVVVGALAASFALSSLLYPAIGVGEAPEFVRARLYLFDLGAFYRNDPEAIPDQARPSLEAYAEPGEYRTGFNCHWAGNPFQSRFYEPRPISVPELSSAWTEVLIREPFAIIGNHLCGAAPTWNPIPAPEELAFRETVVDYVVVNPQGIHSDPASDRLGAAARSFMAWIGRSAPAQVLMWRAATWMWVLVAVLSVGAARIRRPVVLWLLVPFVALSVSVVAFAGTHYRYMAPGWIGAVLLLPLGLQILRMCPGIGENGADQRSPSPEANATHEAHHPDPLLQRGGDASGHAG